MLVRAGRTLLRTSPLWLEVQGSERGRHLESHSISWDLHVLGRLPLLTESPGGFATSLLGKIQGTKPPSVWTRLGDHLQLFVVHRGSGNSSWEIPRASKAEEGTYECTAVSGAGTGRAKAQMVVTGLSLWACPHIPSPPTS